MMTVRSSFIFCFCFVLFFQLHTNRYTTNLNVDFIENFNFIVLYILGLSISFNVY